VNGNELANCRELVLESFELCRHFDDGRETAVFASQLRELARVAQAGRVGERSLDFLGARQSGREPVTERQMTSACRRTRRGRAWLGELLAEAFDAPGGVHEPLLAGEERMARAADVRVNLRPRRARFERISATADDRGGGVLGMNVGFHWNLEWSGN